MYGLHSVDSLEGLISLEGLNGRRDCRGSSKEGMSVEVKMPGESVKWIGVRAG